VMCTPAAAPGPGNTRRYHGITPGHGDSIREAHEPLFLVSGAQRRSSSTLRMRAGSNYDRGDECGGERLVRVAIWWLYSSQKDGTVLNA
jgi:hypothetical protein